MANVHIEATLRYFSGQDHYDASILNAKSFASIRFSIFQSCGGGSSASGSTQIKTSYSSFTANFRFIISKSPVRL